LDESSKQAFTPFTPNLIDDITDEELYNQGRTQERKNLEKMAKPPAAKSELLEAVTLAEGLTVHKLNKEKMDKMFPSNTRAQIEEIKMKDAQAE
jgi:hypothetical protein